ncbi:MAG TPA: hypothetical protein VEC93_08925 [Anaerolineae bacterium]|nr:hypothetical protein [Anaerolineae bacterium]
MASPLVAAGVGAGINYLGAKKSAEASENAANRAAKVAKRQMAQNKEIYDTQKAELAPWRDAGLRALSDIQTGISNGSFDAGKFQFDVKEMEKDPGYQFRVKEGNRLASQRVGAGGKYFSTQGQKQLDDYSQNLASQEYGNAYNRARQEHGMESDRLGNKYTMLRGLDASGQSAVNQAANAGQNFISNNTTQGGRLTNAYRDIGEAKASPWNTLADMGGVAAGAGAQKWAAQA